jgi:hypothetical protein
MTTISNLLDAEQKEFEAKKLELEKQFEKRKSDLLVKVKLELANALTKALKVFQDIPADVRGSVLSDAAFAPIFKDFGLKYGKVKRGSKGKGGSPAVKVTGDMVLTYLSDGPKSVKDIIANFKSTNITIGLRLKELLKEKKVTFKKDGTSKIYSKA